MDAFITSSLLVAAAEMGDKTQLIALVLACRYKKPLTILCGIFVATILNHLFAAYIGTWAAQYVDHHILRWGLAFIFIAFAFWILIPDKAETVSDESPYGVFWTTVFIFFWAEMGDKTQLATIAMAAKFQNTVSVTAGTTLGMMVSNGLAVIFGKKVSALASMKWIRIFSCILFLIFGVIILLY